VKDSGSSRAEVDMRGLRSSNITARAMSVVRVTRLSMNREIDIAIDISIISMFRAVTGDHRTEQRRRSDL